MPLDDKEKASLRASLMNLDDEELDELHERLTDLNKNLDDLNSAFPETKRFLESRGVSKVSDLDARGRQELTEHLKKVLTGLRMKLN